MSPGTNGSYQTTSIWISIAITFGHTFLRFGRMLELVLESHRDEEYAVSDFSKVGTEVVRVD